MQNMLNFICSALQHLSHPSEFLFFLPIVTCNTCHYSLPIQNTDMSSNRRLKLIAGHLDKSGKTGVSSQDCAATSPEAKPQSQNKIPGRQDILKWNGWGYKDSQFMVKDGKAQFTGSRYLLGGLTFPKLADWFTKECHADINISSPSKPLPDPSTLPTSQINQPFFNCVKECGIQFTLDPHTRLFHGHGHTCHEIFELRHGVLHRIPDIVIWPSCHKDVEKIVRLAVEQRHALRQTAPLELNLARCKFTHRFARSHWLPGTLGPPLRPYRVSQSKKPEIKHLLNYFFKTYTCIFIKIFTLIRIR